MKTIEVYKTEKHHHLERLLEKGAVMLFVDTRRPGVDIPPDYQGNPKLPLNISYTFQIPDFKILPDHIEATLTFPSGKHFCRLPLDAVYAFSSQFAQETIVFPEDLPEEYLPHAPVNGKETDTKKIDPSKKLSLVTGKRETDSDEPPPSSGKKRHLRVIK